MFQSKFFQQPAVNFTLLLFMRSEEVNLGKGRKTYLLPLMANGLLYRTLYTAKKQQQDKMGE